MPVAGAPKLQHSDLLSLEQLAGIAQWLGSRLGIQRIKLTGGEPLVRRGIETLVSRLCAIPGVQEVSLTTNGSLLPQKAAALKAAGLKRVTVSLDSLDEQAYRDLTRGGRLANTMQGIAAARRAGLDPIKLNAVLLRSSWQTDVPRLLDFAAGSGFEVRFIELMRTGTERKWCDDEFVSASEVRNWLACETSVLQVLTDACAPARLTRVVWAGQDVAVGWIAPRSQPFCRNCDRLRMDARGRIHRCLMDPNFFDLADVLAQNGSSSAETALARYLAGKTAPSAMDRNDAMNVIGG